MTDWKNLRHAYGEADDVPALLAALTPEADAEVWDELWSRLCHQGTVYSASFAVLPVLLDAANRWKPADRTPALVLAAAIAGSDDVQGCRNELLRPVEWVVPRLRELCCETLAQRGLPRNDFIYLLEAARSLDGDQIWGGCLHYLADGELPGACPHCGSDLYLVIGDHGFFTTAEDWIIRGATPSPSPRINSDVRRLPIEPNTGPLPEDGRWLHELAWNARQDVVADWIRYLFGISVCPECDQSFAMRDAIAPDV